MDHYSSSPFSGQAIVRSLLFPAAVVLLAFFCIGTSRAAVPPATASAGTISIGSSGGDDCAEMVPDDFRHPRRAVSFVKFRTRQPVPGKFPGAAAGVPVLFLLTFSVRIPEHADFPPAFAVIRDGLTDATPVRAGPAPFRSI